MTQSGIFHTFLKKFYGFPKYVTKISPTEAPLGRPTHLQHLTWCEQSRTKTPACNYPVKIILHCQGLINQLHYWFLSCHCNISAHRKMAFCPAKVKTGAAPGPNITRAGCMLGGVAVGAAISDLSIAWWGTECCHHHDLCPHQISICGGTHLAFIIII